MARLVIVIEVPDIAADPKTTDPHDIAEWMMDDHNRTRSVNGDHLLGFVSAEWETQ